MKIVKIAALVLFAAMPSFAAESVCYVRAADDVADKAELPVKICIDNAKISNDGTKIIIKGDKAISGSFGLATVILKPYPQQEATVLRIDKDGSPCSEAKKVELRLHLSTPQQGTVNLYDLYIYGKVAYTYDVCHSGMQTSDVVYKVQ